MAENKPKFTNVAADDPAYQMLDDLIASHHSHLSEAKIALVWAHTFKPDRDGNVTWGQAKKVSPLEKQFHDHDFIILINDTVWQELGKTPLGQKALLDHELCHCGSSTDDDGEVTYYMVKHDLEEFVEIAKRYGYWRANLEAVVKAALEQAAKKAAEDARTEATVQS